MPKLIALRTNPRSVLRSPLVQSVLQIRRRQLAHKTARPTTPPAVTSGATSAPSARPLSQSTLAKTTTTTSTTTQLACVPRTVAWSLRPTVHHGLASTTTVSPPKPCRLARRTQTAVRLALLCLGDLLLRCCRRAAPFLSFVGFPLVAHNPPPPHQLQASSSPPVVAAATADAAAADDDAKHGAALLRILALVEQARLMIANDLLPQAKEKLHEAMRHCEATADYVQLSAIADLLVSIAIAEGRIADAEELLVRFIEKMLQLGVADTDNQVVRYRLKLSRLYQVVGNTQMAEIGYRSCVSMQEEKLAAGQAAAKDPYTHLLYLSALFWYGRFLTEGRDLVKAHACMRRALDHERAYAVLQPAQLMVFLFHTAEIAFKMEQFDDSLAYLTQAVDVCMKRDPDNAELPVFLVKMGVVFYHMRMLSEAQYWCEKGRYFARQHGNKAAEEEAEQCLRRIQTDGGANAGVTPTATTAQQERAKKVHNSGG